MHSHYNKEGKQRQKKLKIIVARVLAFNPHLFHLVILTRKFHFQVAKISELMTQKKKVSYYLEEEIYENFRDNMRVRKRKKKTHIKLLHDA